MTVTLNDNVYTGTAEADEAVATVNNETFDLKGGADTIDFTGARGYSGENTVIIGENEDLSITLGNDEYTCYKDGDDIKIYTNSKVRYYVTAKFDPVVEDTVPLLLGDPSTFDPEHYMDHETHIPIHPDYIVNIGGEDRVIFRIERAYNSGSSIGAGYYDYIWRNEFGQQGKDEPECPHKDVLLSNQAFIDDSFTVGNTIFSDFKVIKEYYVDNDALGSGIVAEDVTEAYIQSITDANSYNQNYSYMASTVTSNITLQDFAKEDIGSDVTITNDGSKVSEKTFNVGYSEGETSYEGLWIGENIYAIKGEKNANINDTIDLKTGNDVVTYDLYFRSGYSGPGYASDVETNQYIGNDVITYNENENLEIRFRGITAGQVEYSLDGDDIILTVYNIYKQYSGSVSYSTYNYYLYTDLTKDILGTVRIVNGAKENFGNGTIKFTASRYGDYSYDISNSNFIMGKDYVTQAQNIVGSSRNELYAVGWGSDTITTTGGDNTIYLRKPGNNTINLTKGINSKDFISTGGTQYDYYQGANPNKFNSAAQNKTVIKNTDQYDTIDFNTSFSNDYYGAVDFYKDSNNLDVVLRCGSGNGGNTSRYTIEDYFGNESKINIVTGSYNTYALGNGKFVRTYDDETYDHKIRTLVEGSGTIDGTNNDEGFFATDAATIKTGNGDDVIYTSVASDTIKITGVGEKRIKVDPNSGDDTVIVEGFKKIDAGKGNDSIKATNLEAISIYGGEGDDKIEVNLGGNVISGGKGSDYIVSKNNTDRENVELVFNIGDGKDFVEIDNANVSLKFPDMKNFSGFKYLRYSNDLFIQYTSSDTIVIKDYYKEFEGTLADYNNNETEYNAAVSAFNNKKSTFELVSNKNSKSNLASLVSSVYDLKPEKDIIGSTKSDYINVSGRIDTKSITTNGGDDTIIADGLSGATIDSGDGNNTIVAKNITNTSINSGNGMDKVEVSGTTSQISTGIGRDTVIAQNITNSTINTGYTGDSSYYDDDDIQISGEGNSVIGGKGNDYISNIKNQTSNNAFEFNTGDGHDVVDFDGGVQTLKFNEINKGNITLQKFGRNLLVKYSDNDRVTIRGFYDANSQSANYYKILCADMSQAQSLSEFISAYTTEHGEITAMEDTANSSLTIYGTDYSDYVEFTGNSEKQYTIKTDGGYENDYGKDFVDVTVNNSKIYTYDGEDTITVRGNSNNVYGGYSNDIITVTGNSNNVYGQEYNDTITVTGDSNNIYGGKHYDTITVTGNSNFIRSGNTSDDYDDTVEVSGANNTIYTGDYYDTIVIKGNGGNKGGNKIHSGDDSDYITNNGRDCGDNTIYFGYNEEAYNAGYSYYECYDTGIDTLDFDKGTQTLKFNDSTLNNFTLKQRGNDLRIYYYNGTSSAAEIKDYFDTTKTKATYMLDDSSESAAVNLDDFVASYKAAHDGNIEQENVSAPSSYHYITDYGTITVDDLETEYAYIHGGDDEDHIIANVNNSNIYGDDGNAYYYRTGNDLIEVAGSNNTVYGEHYHSKNSLGGNDYFKNIDGKLADNTTIVFRGDDGVDTVDFHGGTQTLRFDGIGYSYKSLNLVKDSNDLLIRYSANSSVRVVNYFNDSITDKANYIIKRSKKTGETDADATITLENLIEQNGIIDETISNFPEHNWTVTATETNNLAGTDGSDNLVIDDNVKNAQIYIEYDPYNITRPTYESYDTYFAFKEPFTYEKEGDDLIIGHVGSNYNPTTKQNETKNGSIRIKNYFSEEYENIKLTYGGNENETYTISEVIKKCVTFDVKGKSNANNNLVGSKYSEKFIGGSRNDIITTGSGDDTVLLGKGNDTINIDGSGDKSVILNKGDGKTTINGVENSSSVNIDADDYNNNQVSWSKSGNNIIIHFLDTDTLKSDDITISDYFTEDGYVNNSVSSRLQVNGSEFLTSTSNQFASGKKIKSTDSPTTLAGTGKKDTITSNVGGDVVYAGAGDDTIYINAEVSNEHTHVYPGKGKDRIIIKDSKYETLGTTYLHFKEGEGNKTVVLSEKLENTKHSIEFCIERENYDNHKVEYRKVGNDLYIDAKYGNYDYSINSYKYSTTTIRVQNYFTYAHGNMYIKEGNNSEAYLANKINESYLNIAGKYNKKSKSTIFEGSNNNDNIKGTDKNDIITTGDGRDYIKSGKGNDTVVINGSGDKVIYYKKGANNVIKLGENVESFGDISLQTEENSPQESSYKIDDKGNFTVYRTYVDGDNITTNTTKIMGIKPVNAENPAGITYGNITSSSGGLNISGKLYGPLSDYVMNEGNSKKANKITTQDGKNLVLGGKKNDTITLNGNEERTYTGAGNDKVNANGNSAKIYTGSGNDTISVASSSADVYGGKGNDTILLDGKLTTGENPQPDTSVTYNMYYAKGDGNDTIQIGDNFAGSLYFKYYGDSSNYSTTLSHQIIGNDLVLYRTYRDINNADNILTESTTIKGIKATSTETPAEINYANILNTGAGLNISGLFKSMSSYVNNMVQGNAKKANTLTSAEGLCNVVTGGKKNDKITVKGAEDVVYSEAGNDIITIDNGSSNGATVYAGSGNDTINIDNTYSAAVYVGKGKDTVNVNSGTNGIYITAGEGSNTFNFGSEFTSCNIVINNYVNYDNNSNIVYGIFRSGDDLLIKDKYNAAKKKVKTETQTIKNYFADADNLENKIKLRNTGLSNYLNGYGVNIIGKFDKKKKATVFEGTKYKDNITGTKKIDIVTTGNGDDIINLAKGNDNITIDGSGEKSIVIGHGDGNDVIQWADSDAATGVANLSIDRNDILSSKKSGTDLILTRIYESGKSLKSETTTIKGYYDAEGNIVEAVANKLKVNGTVFDSARTYNRKDYKTSTINVADNYEFAVGTKKADSITVTADNSAIYSFAGNDIINLNSENAGTTLVTAGAGNDTINLNTVGTVSIRHTGGDGNDTINFGENTPSAVYINLESSAFNNNDGKFYQRLNSMLLSGKFGFRKSGDNLVINVPVTSKSSSKTETITLTDYFNNDVTKPNTYLSFNSYSYAINTFIGSYGIWVEGINNNGVTTYTGLEDYVNRYEYKGKGKAVIYGSATSSYSKQEHYLVNLGSKSNLTIDDKGGSNEKLYISKNYKNLKAFINVNSNGKVEVSADKSLSDNFMIFNKGSLTKANITNIVKGKDGKGVININNFFDETAGNSIYTNGTGEITYIYDSNDQSIISEGWIYQMCEQVSGWLSSYGNGKYAGMSSLDVIEGGNTKDINAMLKVYNSITYDKTFTT